MKRMVKQCIAAVLAGCMMLGVFSPGVSYAAEIQETEMVQYQEDTEETVDLESDTAQESESSAVEIEESEVESIVESELEQEETVAVVDETEMFPEQGIEWLDAEEFVDREYDFSNIPKDYEVSDDGERLKNRRASYEEGIDWNAEEGIQTYANSLNNSSQRFVKAYGIDVSSYNGVIDWAKVRAAGVTFAFIRVGGRGYGASGSMYADDRCDYNIKQAIANGIDVGVYFFSTALNEREVLEEAKYTVDVIKNYKITYPVVYDCELYDNPVSRNYKLSNKIRTDNAIAFLKYVESQGYQGMMYSAAAHFRYESMWETSRLDKNYDIWVANYPLISIAEDSYAQIPNHIRASEMQSSYEGGYRIWQCSEKGMIDGIKGYVDLNIEYQGAIDPNYTGLLWINGSLCYVEKGKISNTYTGVVTYNNQKYYIENGKTNHTYEGLINYNGKLYYVERGLIISNYTGIAVYKNTIYYMENGVHATSFSGLAGDDSVLYLIENGVLDDSFSGLLETEDGTVYYAEDGIVDLSFTSLVVFDDGAVYIRNGVLAADYTGLVQYRGAWFYVEKGQLNWNYTGLCQYKGAWFYVENGLLNWNYTGLCQYRGAWFYVEKGQLNWNYTGLCQYRGAWFYVEKGQLNWNYTGLCQYRGTWFYVEKGQLNWKYTGLANYKDQWYYAEKGQVTHKYTGLVCYKDNWYYVANSYLGWNYTGLAYYRGAWFYVRGSILRWSYSGYVWHQGKRYYVTKGVARLV